MRERLPDRQKEFVRALEEARDYLEFSAEKADFQDNEDYLAVRNYLEHAIKLMKT